MNGQQTDVATIEQQVLAEVGDLLTAAQACTVNTLAEAKVAKALLEAITQRERKIEAWFDGTATDPGPVRLAHQAWKALTTRRAAILKRFTPPKDLLRRRLGQYEQQREAARLAAERQALQAARAEAERLKYARAEQAMDAGQLERAERILDAPPPPVLVPTVAVEDEDDLDLPFTEHWTVAIDDPAALVRAIADGQAPPDAVVPNEVLLRAMARALKGAFSVPGCRAVMSKIPRVQG